jgi:hypothetical protein
MAYYETEHLDDFIENNKNDLLNEVIKLDRGHTKIFGFIERSDGSLKKTKISIYTSGFIGNHIRDAETGEYFKEIIGSLDEDLYFKLAMSNGEVKSKNDSNTLFYKSPQHCMNHLHIDITPEIIQKWENKRNQRLLNIRNIKQRTANVIIK